MERKMEKLVPGEFYLVRGKSIPIKPCNKVGQEFYFLPKGTKISILEIAILPRGKSAINIIHHPRLKKLEGVIVLVDTFFLVKKYFRTEYPKLRIGMDYVTTKSLKASVCGVTGEFILLEGSHVYYIGTDKHSRRALFAEYPHSSSYYLNFLCRFNPRVDLEYSY